jgi:hypothetical protein
MEADENDIPEEWSSVSGFVPLLEAEQRLAVSRRALGGVEGLIATLTEAATTEAAEQLDLTRADPVAAEYARETEMALDEEVLADRDELPLMLFGILVVYQFSLLESCLAGCLENVAAVQGKPPPRRVPNPKIEGYLEALRTHGVIVEWDEALWRELGRWRSTRNEIVHRLDTPLGARTIDAALPVAMEGERSTAAALELLVEVIEGAIAEVDTAMSRIGG